jgi:hypothetical protein
MPYKTYVRKKHVESILGTCKNLTKKTFNLNNTIPHTARLVDPYFTRYGTYAFLLVLLYV